MQYKRILIASLWWGLFAAGCTQISPPSSADGSASGIDGTAIGNDAGGCGSAIECPPNQVCAPKTGQCSASLGCKQHGDCGRAAFCAAGEQCAQSATGSPCANSNGCVPGETCLSGFCGCKGQSYQADKVPANVLIVLDRSNSMNDSIKGGTKWSVAKKAIGALLASMGGQIRFGLALYPGLNQGCSSGQDCGTGAVFMDPGSTPANMNAFLANARTCNFGTPTAEILTTLLAYKGLQDAQRANFILLITDGQSTCADPLPVVTALRAKVPEIKTFAVGFGSEVDADELNGIAERGGTAIAGGPPYYHVAGDADSLARVLATIAGSVLSCSYTLSAVPANVNNLYVYQGQQAIARDTAHKSGWDYAASTKQLTFYGAPCESLRAGKDSDVTIVYGCPVVIK